MDEALVSVIMPFYNVAPYFREAVESVLVQTDARWELLLADDGSTDGSTAIAVEYAGAYPEKIRLLRHRGAPHQGTVAARNLAIAEAKGDYLAFLDADDVWLPGKLAYQLSLARSHPQAALICGATWYWYSWTHANKADERIAVGGPQDVLVPPPGSALALYPLGRGAAPCLCSILLSRRAASRYRDLEEHFSGRNQLYEDQAFLVRIYLHEAVYISSRAMDLYRQRPDSTRYSLVREGHYNRVRNYFFQWLAGYLDDNDIHDPAVRKKLWEARRRHWLHRVRQKIRTLSARLGMKRKTR
jgi:glycosyltransferase involved in cell wall biosynthesis